ncbi:hypothetical protein EXW31_21440 [Bacillus mycoides]|uniref:hypothetical protein n=1 Tax=Bacillus mycoides TaxID=1405 RepID=UPI001C02DE0E|nr:hypothetical protein [Bacillus mycoides]QWG46684.1 hypothetical protein EXW31_21440 [Bacillus mycoides]QWH13831.1 hypothetical protein EXW38_21760 [Bacillus mycoides]
MRYATSLIRNLVVLTLSFFLLSACGQQTSPTKTEVTKEDTAASKDSTKNEDSQKTEDSVKTEDNENNIKTENNTTATNNTKTENNSTTKNDTKAENNTTATNNTKAENNSTATNNTKNEAESKNTQKDQQPNKQTDTIKFTSDDAVRILEKRMGARSDQIHYGSGEDQLIGTINGIKLYDVLYARGDGENQRALNFAVGSDGNVYDWSKAQDGILQPLNSN